MRKGKRFIAIALSVAMMLPYASSAGTIDASAAEADDQQVTATSTDAGEYSEPETELAADDEAEAEENTEADIEDTDIAPETATDTALSVLQSAGQVEINETYFPDTNFRDFVTTNYGTTDDGKTVLTKTSAESVTTMDISSKTTKKTISDLTGIE
jgi:hypothetical protein